MDDNSKKKDQCILKITFARKQLLRILKEGQNIVENAQSGIDLANASETVVGAFPEDKYLSPVEWDRYIMSWDYLGQSLAGFSYKGPMLQIATDSTSATMTYLVFQNDIIENLPPPAKEIAQQGAVQFKNVLERRPLLENVVLEMQRLGLDKTFHGERSAITLLKEAVSSAQQPVGEESSPISVLLPIREAIEKMLADLLQKRPIPETAKPYAVKVKSILTQCGKDGLSSNIINELGDNVGLLHDKLSGGKKKNLTSSEINEMLIQGQMFLKSFLECIDEGKFRK